jgi:tripartite-type tricarboxylate transporter receptor subunit TctC
MIQQSVLPFIGSLAAALVWAATSTVQAQPAPFPSGTIRFVAPFSASTPPDIISRIVSKELTESEGWRVIVENRPGGVTTIAATDVLSQPADGHSLYAMSVPSVAAPSLVPNISFNLDKDFEPVIKATVSYNVLVVNPSVPAKTGQSWWHC